MPVRIRLARHGQRNTPLYHIVAINSTKRRDARPLEKLGEYDPIPRIPEGAKLPPSAQIFYNAPSAEASGSGSSSFKTTGQRNAANNGQAFEGVMKEKRIEWNVERIKYWLGTGAQPSDTVVRLLERGGILTTPHPWQHKYSPPAAAGPDASAPTAGKIRNPFAPQPKAASGKTSTSADSITGIPFSTTGSSPEGITDAAGENTGFAGVTAT